MKIIFTFLLIFFFTISSYAQDTSGANQKVGTQTSGITAENQSFSVDKIYPNPAKDFVTIDLRSEVTGTIQVSLFNILGTEVKKWEGFFVCRGDQKLKIDLSSIRSGIYFLKISTSNQVQTQVLKKIRIFFEFLRFCTVVSFLSLGPSFHIILITNYLSKKHSLQRQI
jgi:hypothetical protein